MPSRPRTPARTFWPHAHRRPCAQSHNVRVEPRPSRLLDGGLV